jgi:predicted permease
MARFCTVDSIGEHFVNLILSVIGVIFAVAMAILLTRFFVKDKSSSDWGVYAYALAFANSGYMGDPLILMLLGEQAFAFYKLFTLPITFAIYSWGLLQLAPRGTERGSFLKNLLNFPMIATTLGAIFGLSGLGSHLPAFINQSLDTLKVCMGPGAMLVAGFTIANYPIKEILTKRKVYLATLLRLTLIPAILIGIVFLIKTALSSILGISINNNPLYLLFFASASAIGLNTVVFPEAYGGDPKTGAAMAMISHTLSVLTIPIMYALLNFVFGPAAF